MPDRPKILEFLGITLILLLIAGMIPSKIPARAQAFSSCYSPLPLLDQTFFFSEPMSLVENGGPAINITATNNSSLTLQVFVWIVIHNELRQTVYIGIANMGEVGCGVTTTIAVPFVLAAGSYNVSASLTTLSMIQVSTVQTFVFNYS